MRRADKETHGNRRAVRLLLCLAWNCRYSYAGAVIGIFLLWKEPTGANALLHAWEALFVGSLAQWLLIDWSKFTWYSKRLNVTPQEALPWWWEKEPQ